MNRRQARVVAIVTLTAPAALVIVLWDALWTGAKTTVRHFCADLRREVRDAVEMYRYSPAEQADRLWQQARAGFAAPRTVTVREDADDA